MNVIQRCLTRGRSDVVAAFGRVIGPVRADQREEEAYCSSTASESFFFLLPAGWDRLSSFVLHLSLTRKPQILRFSLSQLWPQTSAIRLLDYQVIAKIQRRGDNNRVWRQSGCKSAVSSTDSGQEQTQRAQGVCAKAGFLITERGLNRVSGIWCSTKNITVKLPRNNIQQEWCSVRSFTKRWGSDDKWHRYTNNTVGSPSHNN